MSHFITKEEQRRASSLVRTYAPRGAPSARMREAYRLRVEEELPIDEVAKRLGVHRKTAERYVTVIRQELR